MTSGVCRDTTGPPPSPFLAAVPGPRTTTGHDRGRGVPGDVGLEGPGPATTGSWLGAGAPASTCWPVATWTSLCGVVGADGGCRPGVYVHTGGRCRMGPQRSAAWTSIDRAAGAGWVGSPTWSSARCVGDPASAISGTRQLRMFRDALTAVCWGVRWGPAVGGASGGPVEATWLAGAAVWSCGPV